MRLRQARRQPAGVELVVDVHHLRAAGQSGSDVRLAEVVVGLSQAREVVQEQHQIGLGDLAPAARDADALDLVGGLAQARGVDHMHRHTLDLDGLADLVAGGARDRRDDGQLRAGQGIEQRTLAHVGLAGQHEPDAPKAL